jgi:hypothetical protein
MALKQYGTSGSDNQEWVTLGGINRKTGKANPTKVSGYYLGVTKGVNTFDETKEKITIILQKEDGNKIGVNASSNMVIQLERAEKGFKEEEGREPVGSFAQIEFTGEMPSKKGNPLKLFSVLFDPDDTLSVNEEVVTPSPEVVAVSKKNQLNSILGKVKKV